MRFLSIETQNLKISMVHTASIPESLRMIVIYGNLAKC